MSGAGEGRVTGFWHAGITVSEMERSLRFYRDGLGLEVTSRRELAGSYCEPVVGVLAETVDVVFLAVPGNQVDLELFEYRGIERHSASARPCDYGAGHICLYVDDIELVFGRLESMGYTSRRPIVTIEGGIRDGAKAVYTQDPDGYSVELFQPAPRPKLEPVA